MSPLKKIIISIKLESYILRALACSMFVLMFCPMQSYADEKINTTLVLLEQYGTSALPQMTSDFINHNKLPNSIILTEFMDSYIGQLKDDDLDEATKYLVKSYTNKGNLIGIDQFDKVIAIGTVPSRFLDNNPEFQAGAERYFLHINWQPSTGKLIPSDFEAQMSLDQILKLFPRLEQIFIVTSPDNSGQKLVVKKFMDQQEKYPGILLTELDQTLDADSFKKTLQSSSPSAVIVTDYFSESLNWLENNKYLRAQKFVPTFTIFGHKIDEVLGGVVVSPVQLGNTVLKIAADEEFQTDKNYGLSEQVNYNKLKDFDLAESDLPLGTEIVNKPKGFSLLDIVITAAIGLVVVLIILIIYSIKTKRLAIETELANKTQMRMSEQQIKLFAIIGHELRTPASILRQLMDEEDLDLLKNGKTVNTTLNHMLDVLDDMRAISQPDFAIQSKPSKISLAHRLESASQVLDRIVSEHNLKIVIKTPTTPLPMVIVNAQLVSQITMNLIKNAAYYSKGSTLHIVPSIVSETDDQIKIAITFSDNGIGIPADFRGKLFSAFERTNSEKDGTGLGLHLSKKYAQDYLDGDLVLLESEKGASFELTFTADKQESASSATATANITLQDMSILYAEDNATIRMTTELMLKRAGAMLTTAEDGLKALAAFENGNYDLVLTDIFMPNMNGYELTKALRARGFKKPIFGITASSLGNEIQDLLDAGADTSLIKPLSVAAIKEALAKLANPTDKDKSPSM